MRPDGDGNGVCSTFAVSVSRYDLSVRLSVRAHPRSSACCDYCPWAAGQRQVRQGQGRAEEQAVGLRAEGCQAVR